MTGGGRIKGLPTPLASSRSLWVSSFGRFMGEGGLELEVQPATTSLRGHAGKQKIQEHSISSLR